MKRFAPLLLIVVALAAVPTALADDTSPPAPAAPATQQHPVAHVRLELLRVQLQLVRIRYQLACREATSDRCTQFTQHVTDRLTTLDENVQKKLDDLQCTSDSAEKKCTVLAKLDQRLQELIGKLGSSPSTGPGTGPSTAPITPPQP